MSTNIAPINRLVASVMESQQQIVVVDPWQAASDKDKEIALLREQLLQPILTHMNNNVSANVAIRNVLQNVTSGIYPPRYIETAYKLGRKGKLPGRSTIQNWVKAYKDSGREGLLNAYTGRVRQDYGWEHLAIQRYNMPSKPSYAAVALELREDYGFDTATNSAVTRYLKSLPSTLNETSPLRLGKHYYQQNVGKYITRSTDEIDVGFILQGDGHTVDCYVQHPNNPLRPYRPELTVWIDIRSHYIAGWYMSKAESSLSTLYALSHALLSNDHVPALVHIDNGSGFKAKLLNDESVGFYSRFSISTTFSIPGNSKGKGLVEGWFRPFRDRHDKLFNGGVDYCGHDMAPEINRQLSIQIKQGKRDLRPYEEYVQSVARYIEKYNNRPQKVLGNKSPAELWSTLVKVPVEIKETAVVRPSAVRTVQRSTITIEKRTYEHDALSLYNKRKIEVQYDLHDDSKVWLYDDKHRLICVAPIKKKLPWIPASRIVEYEKKREQGRIQRKERDIENIRIEERSLIDPVQQLKNIESLGFADDDKKIFLDNQEENREDCSTTVYDTLELLEEMDDIEDET